MKEIKFVIGNNFEVYEVKRVKFIPVNRRKSDFESFWEEAVKKFRKLSEQILKNPNEQKVDELLNILVQVAQSEDGRHLFLNTVKNYNDGYITSYSPITRDYIIPFVKKNKIKRANSNSSNITMAKIF